MSEKNNIFENDLLMRAILDGGQEEVPGHIWDAVAEGLDKAEAGRRKKTVTLWWRRAGVGAAAVAAAVASVLVLHRPETADIVPMASDGGMIAVVEDTEDAGEALAKGTARLVAYVPAKEMKAETPAVAETPEELETAEEAEEVRTEVPSMKASSYKAEPMETSSKEYFPSVWEEDEKVSKVKTSVVVSGITGAAGSGNSQSNGMLKAPAVTLAPSETGITEKNSTSRYGLPVSVGAGVKIGFTSRWSLGVGLNYTCLTRTFNGTYTHVSESGAIDNLITSDIRNTQHYIGIPVNAYYNIVNSKHINFYAYAGGTVEKCVSDKYRVITNSIIHKEPVKGVQLSANIGFGAEFMLGEHVGLYLDPSLRYYFDCDQPKSIRTAQPLMLGFELGFRFRL